MRPEIFVVHSVNAANSLADLDQSPSGNEVGLFIFGITDRAIDLISQSIVQGQTRLDLPVVLSIEADRVLVYVAMRVSKAPISQVGFA